MKTPKVKKNIDEKSFKEFKKISNFKIIDQSSKIHHFQKKWVNTICITFMSFELKLEKDCRFAKPFKHFINC
jgi:hypothetical protein